MLNIHGSSVLRKIIVLNPKGGAGKTTLAFNLAGYLASTGRKVALIDMDQQRSSSHWLVRRPTEFPVIHGVSDFPYIPGTPLNASISLPAHIDFAVVDTPAGVTRDDLPDFTVGSHAIIVPVMPSEIDIHAAIGLIADLLLVARGSRENKRLGVVANRVKQRTIAANHLMTFLNRLSIPVIGVIRDSQNYVNAAREGLCIHELQPSKAGKDLRQWKSITNWLEKRLETPLNERDLLRPKPKVQAKKPVHRFNWQLASAAVVALFVVSGLLWNFTGVTDDELPITPIAAIENSTQKNAIESGPGPFSEEAATVPEEPAEPVALESNVKLPVEDVKGGEQYATAFDKAPVFSDLQHSFDGADSIALAANMYAASDEAVDYGLKVTTSDGISVSNEPLPGPFEAESASGQYQRMLPTRADELARNWQLTGIANSGGEYVVLLSDSSVSSTRTITEGGDIDGWSLKDAGMNFAVLAKHGEDVRLHFRTPGNQSKETQAP